MESSPSTIDEVEAQVDDGWVVTKVTLLKPLEAIRASATSEDTTLTYDVELSRTINSGGKDYTNVQRQTFSAELDDVMLHEGLLWELLLVLIDQAKL